ncbi:protein-disulfide reductase DsbD [Pantoea sp. BAV 3049]|uniref:protein-disulfide reductase DsbD family protein n=1 Tax=Pantoea sp. BAV 3049 TaxID=2654188 RepID=UPI00131A6B9C|nr:protein-disulfide reductase DsbD domain-containing protein [Pantoea sp. BAV 3049]
MLRLFRSLALLSGLLWLPALQAADSGWMTSPQNGHAQIRLRAENIPGKPVQALLDIHLQDGWKTYWRSPGEGGVAPVIHWQPESVKAQWFWPAPQRFDVAGLSTQGYHHQVSLPIELKNLPAGKLSGTLTLPICSNVCILTDYPFELDLSTPADDQFTHDFAQAMGKVPLPSGLSETLHAGYQPGLLQITITRKSGWNEPQLYLDDHSDASFGKPTLTVKGDTLQATIPVSDQWGDNAPDLQGGKVSLVLTDRGLAQQSELEIGAPLAAVTQGVALWQVMLIALAGGFILNLMPCVLPVLGMKLGSILQVEQRDKRSVRLQFVASSAGIISSFMALAVLMTGLRLSNHALGWGIQFQNPWFIAFMALVTLLFSASLFGLYYFRLPSSLSTRLATHNSNGLTGHFLQGAFATLLATPCSAPFLGTAVAFALAASLPVLWIIFIALGVGMSLPWLLIALLPSLALKLPKPGRWMNVVRLAMASLMLLSALWLLSLLTSHLGTPLTLTLTGAVLLLLWFAAWRIHGRKTAAICAGSGALLAGSILLAASLSATGLQGTRQDKINWQPLSEQAISEALTSNKRVFVEVTADWCISCKANKYNVLLRSDVQQALQADDVVALRGDWSRPSATITAFLQRRGSVAVPFNQVYGPGNSQGTVLSPLLDHKEVLTVLTTAKGSAE